MLSRFIFLLLFCSFYSRGNAQNAAIAGNTDTVLFARADSAFKLAFRNSDSALLLARTVLAEAISLKDKRCEANAWNAIGWATMHQGNLDSSVLCLEKAWQLFKSTGSDNDLIRVCINISEVYTKQNKISEAIKYLTQADSLCVKTKNTVFHTNVWRQLGVVYRESGDNTRAAFYLNKALEGFDKLKDHFRYVSTGISLSILYRNMKLLDSSLSILNRCDKITRKETNMPYQLAMVQEHIAETYYSMERYNDALDHYSNAYAIFKNMSNKADLAYESISVGKTLSKLGRFDEAERYLLTAIAMSDSLKMDNYQWDASSILASMYQKKGDWKKAFQYLQKVTVLGDSINLAQQIAKTNELKEKFESEKKESEIMLLKARNELAESGGRRNRLIQYIFIILFAASVMIGWLLINRARIKRNLDAQILRNQIAGDLHDDIGSALSAIDIGSRVAMAKNENQGAVQEQLVKIQQHARKTLDSMSDIVWSVNPQNDNFESLLMRLRSFAAEICEPLNIDLQFKVSNEVEGLPLDIVKRKNVFLICKEAINNAVKYSSCHTLFISFELASGRNLQVIVRDDGIGFDEETIKKGNGLRNMKLRAGNMNAVLDISSGVGKGVSVQLNCPV